MTVEQHLRYHVQGEQMSDMTTLDNFSRNAVENFLQTVVFVDDKIYAPRPTGIIIDEKKVSAPKTRKPATKSAAVKVTKAKKVAVVIPPSEDAPTFSPHDIQASFAKKRIVCSLHQPHKHRSVGVDSDTYKLCASADIVIVDWDLYGDAGERAKKLVENLIVQSLKEDPHQLRLVLIYTDTPDLFALSNEIYEGLTETMTDNIEFKDADNGLAFHTSNARVVVLGKPINRLARFKPFEVNEAELVDKAISEFCKLSDGMLQGGILMGLAAIRKQSKRILTKFYSGLDAAFLTHRALSQPDEEAFDHVTPLLVSEIQAVLEDNLESPLFPPAVVEDWCNKRKFGKHAQALVQGCEFKRFAYDFCCYGFDVNKKHNLKSPPSKKQLQSLLCPDKANDDPPQPDISSLEQLAVLMSQRTHYDNQRRFLKLGAILKESKGQKRYLLCLQPVCDSVRLSGDNPFLFCYMETITNKVTHVVPDGDGCRELFFNPCKENRVIIKFTSNYKKRVAAAGNSESGYLFSDSNKEEYQWIAQLKPEHAQQAAEQFARELSRVGLTESEWLRLKAK